VIPVMAIVIIVSALGYFFLTPAAVGRSVASCTPNSISSETSGEGLLSGFSIECMSIADNKSTILSGLVYVATSQAQQAQGFMNVTSFGNCNGAARAGLQCVGMIFNFSSNQEACFWMHDTAIPLQQDWISNNGTIVSAFQARPENDSSVCFFAKSVLETFPNASIPVGSIATFSG